MKAINPATGETLETYSTHDEDAIESILATADEAFEEWRTQEIHEREQYLVNAADVLRENKDRYAELMTKEMGKPITQAKSEVEKCAWACEHYAEYAGSYLQDEQYPSPPGTDVCTVYDPLGPVLAVMPWNYPFWQVIRFAAPYLTAGNVGLLKHAANVPGCALALEEVFEEAGYPDGVFQTMLIEEDHVPQRVDEILADDRVKAATLTGSVRAGKAVAESAGKQVKKTVLELGGSDPFIVFEDADFDAAIETGVLARTQNGGQSCIAAKRFLVHESISEEFLDGLVEQFESLTVGDPMDETTDIGPQASSRLMGELHKQVEASVEAGTTVVTGGEPLNREGNYYPPTVLTNVPEGCPAYEEETFGPVASVFEFSSESEAIELANNTNYGLGASIWTEDRKRGRDLATQIEAGCVYINEMVKSDPRIPFGGVKDAGYGRELSEAGIKEFVNRKTVWVN